MGNRAVIKFDGIKTGVYLHWNGGRASIEAFLRAARDLGIRDGDHEYTPARFAQMIGNWMGGTLGVGVGPWKEMDSSDNGVYTVRNWEIIKRSFPAGREELDPKKTQVIYEEVMRINGPIFLGDYRLGTWGRIKRRVSSELCTEL